MENAGTRQLWHGGPRYCRYLLSPVGRIQVGAALARSTMVERHEWVAGSLQECEAGERGLQAGSVADAARRSSDLDRQSLRAASGNWAGDALGRGLRLGSWPKPWRRRAAPPRGVRHRADRNSVRCPAGLQNRGERLATLEISEIGRLECLWSRAWGRQSHCASKR